MVSLFHQTTWICSPIGSAWLSVHWWHRNYSSRQHNSYRESLWLFPIDVCSTHRTRELPKRLVMNVLGPWSNSESESGWKTILKQSRLCVAVVWASACETWTLAWKILETCSIHQWEFSLVDLTYQCISAPLFMLWIWEIIDLCERISQTLGKWDYDFFTNVKSLWTFLGQCLAEVLSSYY